MRFSRTAPAAALLSLALVATGCGSKKKSPDTTVAPETTVAAAPDTTAAAAPDTTSAAATDTTVGATPDSTAAAASATTTAGAAGAVNSDLKAAGCPSPLVIQTDWYGEVDHSELYALAGDGGTVDKEKGRYTAALIDPRNGTDTGVQIEIRNGGPATQFQNPVTLMPTDKSIFAGYVGSDEAVQHAKDAPVMLVMAPREKSPQIIMWDPATYPDVKSIADLKAKKVTIRHFKGATYFDYLLGAGIVDAAQDDPSYDGSSAVFIAQGGKIAQQGFATAEPYVYKNVFKAWGKDVAYQLISETGFDTYAEAIGVTKDTFEAKKGCLKVLVPMLQAAQVNFIKNPGPTEARIVKVVTDEGGSWTYDAGQATAATALSLQNKIIDNGPDKTLGNFDEAKNQKIIDILKPIQAKAGNPIPDGLKPSDFATNEFIDPSIGLP